MQNDLTAHMGYKIHCKINIQLSMMLLTICYSKYKITSPLYVSVFLLETFNFCMRFMVIFLYIRLSQKLRFLQKMNHTKFRKRQNVIEIYMCHSGLQISFISPEHL